MANKKITALTPLTSAASDDVLAIVDVSGTAETKKITVANLTSGIVGAVYSVNTQVGVVVLDSDDIAEGTTNLYYTDARVDANPDVVANTAKVGITPTQASDITTNNAKVGITPTQASEITANTLKVSNVQSDWNASSGLAVILNKPTIPTVPVDSVNGQTGVVVLDSDDIAEGTANLYYTEARVDANSSVVANTAKVGITPTQASDIVTNNAKVGYTDGAVDARIALADIDDLADVVTTSVANNDVLTYDTATGKWINAVSSGGGGLTEYPLAYISGRFQWSNSDGGERVLIGSSSYGPFNWYSFVDEPATTSLREWTSGVTVNVTTSSVDDFSPIAHGIYIPNLGKKVKVRVAWRITNAGGYDWGFSMWDCPSPANGSTASNTVTLRAVSATQTASTDATMYYITEFTTTNAISDNYLFFLAESRSDPIINTVYLYCTLTFTLV